MFHAQRSIGISRAAAPLRRAVGAVFVAGTVAALAQESENRVVVQGEAGELPSAYGAPPDLSHGRISTLTKSYVLSPFSFELETGYEGDFFTDGSPLHLFRQEIEMGLPGRFTIGVQNQFAHVAGDTRQSGFTIEGRYALANWNKLPLNPAVSVEYRFGAGHAETDSGEIALLVSHDFPHLVEWAMNVFVDHEFSGRRSTSAGFAQSIEVPILLPEEKLEVGFETLYRSGGEFPQLGRTAKGLAIGPTLAWRPSQRARFDLSPLFGCSDHTPVLQMFAVFSFSFGRTYPASARGR
jgi:hypothetical protein